MPKLSASDKAAVSKSVKQARLVDASRKMARMVRHADPDAKTKAERDDLEKTLTGWITHHGVEAFSSPFCDDHNRCIAKIEQAVNAGGMFALAMPRGHGKSTILKWAVLYCLLTGRRKYVVAVAATAEYAQAITEFCRQQIQESDTLHAHYPHVTTYARATDGKAIKAKFQLRADGKTSGIQWSKTTLILPEVLDPSGNGYTSNGAILEGHGLTGHIRGRWKDTKTGKTLRPDLVLLDDPQSRESAESREQCDKRERIIKGDVLGLAGPKKRIAAVMPCTIVKQGDLAARFLDHNKHPEWSGETCSLIRKWPDEQDGLWVDYADIYKAQGIKPATKFYRENRKAMDAGSEVSWEHRVRDGELSAIQTAETLLIDSGEQFWAEYQNDPRDPMSALKPYTLDQQIIMSRTNDYAKAERPPWTSLVLASTDINPSYALSTVVLAFGQDQSAAVLWYGLHKCNIKGNNTRPGYDAEVYAELEKHGKALSGMPDSCRPTTWAIDAAGANFDATIRFAERSVQLCSIQAHAYVGTGWKQYKEYGKTYVKQQLRREQCHIRADTKAGRSIKWIRWHADYWREVSQRAWIGAVGSPGSCSLYDGTHTEFAAQASAEAIINTGVGLSGGMEWNYLSQNLVGKHDFGDAMAQGYAAAAFAGIGTGGGKPKAPPRRKASGVTVIPM